jgi:hypothetical protein
MEKPSSGALNKAEFYVAEHLIQVESAGSFGDGRCCHPSGYLQGVKKSSAP